MQSPAAETLQELLQGRGFAASVTQLPRASSMLEVLWPGWVQGETPSTTPVFWFSSKCGMQKGRRESHHVPRVRFHAAGCGVGF